VTLQLHLTRRVPNVTAHCTNRLTAV